MIIDKIANASMYYNINPGLEKVFNFIQEQDLAAITPGKYKIDGCDADVKIQEYTTKNPEDVEWESHKYHLDIQCLIWGEERIGYASIDGIKPIKEYDEAADKLILERTNGDFITLKGDKFVIMFPQDAHQPRVAAETPLPVKKIIVKIPV
jgi:YhcH/YjgK/YiaL family protein